LSTHLIIRMVFAHAKLHDQMSTDIIIMV
jgi:hypothetical protein